MRNIPFGRPILGDEEKAALSEVLDSGYLVHGPKIEEFETAFRAYTRAPYAVGISSCTAGLHLAYFALGIGPGDEVIVPAMTHTATAHAVEYVGATPVFVDAEMETGNIDIERVEAAVTERTRAISVVHYLGLPVDMRRICEMAKRRDLLVIEDCALSVGSTLDGVHTGLFGTCGVFSFYPVKHMTTGEGGMLITNDEVLAGKVAHQRAFGVDRHYGGRKIPGQYDVSALGFNYRMSELHAALGTVQLKRLPGFIEARKLNYERLDAALREIDEISLFSSSRDGFESNYYCHAMVLNDELAAEREDVIRELKARGVGTSVYYPGPLPLMSYYRQKYGHRAENFPVAHRISNASVALPVGPHLEEGDAEYIVQAIKEVICRTVKA